MINKFFTQIFILLIFAQLTIAQNLTLTETNNINWNNKTGLPFIKDFSGNYGVETYAKISKNEYAFLSRVEKKILIFDNITNQKIKEINLNFNPTDFIYNYGTYYITDINNLYVVNNEGKVIDKKYFGDNIKFIESIKIINDEIYLIDNNQNTWNYIKNGNIVKHNGIIIKNNTWAKITKPQRNNFKISVYNKNNESVSKIINSDINLGTVRVLGFLNNSIIIEVQKIVNEVPLQVNRFIKSYSLNNLQEQTSIKLPNINYIYVKHDVLVNNNGIEFFITTPQKASIFKLKSSEINSKKILFPSNLYNYSYHYNNHLLTINKELEPNIVNKSTNAAIYRSQIIANAEPYAVYNWNCNSNNIKDYDCGGVHVTTPSWVSVGNNVAIPYMWGGFSSFPQFDQGISDGVSAGDSYTVGNGSGSGCAVGVDCSGFVSRSWDLPYKYGTSTLPNISTQYSSFSDLLPGDIVNYSGHHVRLVHTLNQDGSFLLIESSASGTDWRVGYNNYTTADLQSSYVPRYYNDVLNDPIDDTLPTTSFTTNNWETQDFQVSFTDDDNDAINERFYQVSYYNGTEWLANIDNGFLHDNFTSGINPQWIQLGSTWTNISETLNQADETNSNTNIYANVTQESGNIYLYKWRMKISGTGTNRRAGIYFMCDDATQVQRNNSYMVYFRVDQNSCQIYKSESNTIDLKTDDNCTVNLDEWFDAKIIFNTNTGEIKVFKDNVLVSTWIDTAPFINANSISLRTGEANVSYDDFAVYKSRNDTVSISVGANSDVPLENTNSSTPACFIESIVTDMSNNFSTIASNYVNIDWSVPTLTTIADGLANDEDYTTNNSEISSNWADGVDANSDISEYFYCVGTSPFANDVINWTSNTTITNFTENGLSLTYDSTYYVSLKAVNGAGLSSDTICSDGNLLVTTLNINELNENWIKIYPNPASNYITIQNSDFKNEKSFNELIKNITITDISGKQINVDCNSMQSEESISIDISKLALGTYFIEIKANNIYRGKFVKK